jgi:hypothetical protein
MDAVETARNICVKPGISGIFDRIRRGVTISVRKQAADSAARAASSLVIESGDGKASMYPSDIKALVHRYGAGQVRQKELDAELAKTQDKKTALERQETAEQQLLSKCQSDRGRAEARYWGLSELR